MLNKVKKAAKKTMENITDTVLNIKEQLTGQKKGTYAKMPEHEYVKQQYQKFERNLKKGFYTDTDDLKENLVSNLGARIKASSKIKAAVKRRQAQRQYEFNKEIKDKPKRIILNEQKKANDELFDVIDRRQYGDDELDIEKVLSKMRVENTSEQMAQQILNDAVHEIDSENKAATTIKSILRGHKGRKSFKYQKDEYPAIAARRRSGKAQAA
jgi:hypothetical protein